MRFDRSWAGAHLRGYITRRATIAGERVKPRQPARRGHASPKRSRQDPRRSRTPGEAPHQRRADYARGAVSRRERAAHERHRSSSILVAAARSRGVGNLTRPGRTRSELRLQGSNQCFGGVVRLQARHFDQDVAEEGLLAEWAGERLVAEPADLLGGNDLIRG